MNRYNGLKEEILKVNAEFEEIFHKTGSFPGVSADSFSGWKKICGGITRQISEDMVRVAVVGPIKSGKSTFVNSLFKNDYLKRGAGVVTSIVTRIHCSDKLKATLCFKSWDEVNGEIEQALSLLPGMDREEGATSFDLRKSGHREELHRILKELTTDQLIQNDARNINTVLLMSYLKGYESVKEIIGPDPVVREYEDDELAEHSKFSGDEILAVYLSDIRLDIKSNLWDSSIEIADCQGSDSPNPLHLAMIQDYLLHTNLIVYVISSRTGLRRADIKFLTMIREMGIMDNMLFVVNCDFSEHESLDDLNRLVEKIRDELSLIRKEPEIFTLSALYNLFKESGGGGDRGHLSERDRLRLTQWEMETGFTALSDRETERFGNEINEKLTRDRYSLLLKNHVERQGVIVSGLGRWAALNREILSRDAKSAGQVVDHIKLHKERMTQVKSMIRSTLDGAAKKVRRDMAKEVDAFFDGRHSTIMAEIKNRIKSYSASCENYIDNIEEGGFAVSHYQAHQDFKQAIDTWLAENIAPKIAGFVRNAEEKIQESLTSISAPYATMVEDSLSQYMGTMEEFGVELAGEQNVRIAPPAIEEIKKFNGLKFPALSSVMRYSVRMKTEAVVRLGAYNIFNLFQKLIRKKALDKRGMEVLVLKESVSRMKLDAARGMGRHFKNHKENIKAQYLYPLIDSVADALYESRVEAFQACLTDLSKVTELIAEKKVNKEQLLDFLDRMDSDLDNTREKISTIRENI